MTDDGSYEDLQYCSHCSRDFPMDDPMVEYDDGIYCSPNCVREWLDMLEPCDHDEYVKMVNGYRENLLKALTQAPPPGDTES